MSGLIFEKSRKGRYAKAQWPTQESEACDDIPPSLLRTDVPCLPEVSELQVVRHYTNLSKKNFSIDTHFYPLGSCTMKYNPRGVHRLTSLEGFLQHHPLSLEENSQGFMACAYELQEILKTVTGMKEAALSPMAGAQGEFAGVAMIRAYHRARNDLARDEILVPDAAHGTNPASAVQCGFKVREIPTDSEGNVDIEALKAVVGPKTAGIMLTNPSTLGVFEQKIQEIARIIHEAGGLLYYDGANFNAILGKVRPGDMGFDVVHLNLHKTFATPHGGGGPGSGPVVANERLVPYLPVPRVAKEGRRYRWLTEKDCPQSIGRLSAFMGNAGIIMRAYLYARLLGKEGLKRVSEFATLNANYLQARLKAAGFTLAYPTRRASHEFIITLKGEKTLGITALDVAKRLLDYGFHAPTMYFPLLVPECLLIEPTETETREVLDAFADALIQILEEAKQNPSLLKNAPHTLPVRRLDDVRAARELDLVYKPEEK
ncbi:aminomethyl-transferring glycine dehydrogenase subunit GcvPB [Aquicella lusitana]|uniref:Probable glycine dehydrogenase (decarboxylating) subunit 2 n=1 Tax=Aquicella lusitana TaxID=254246 RepID=A0A370GMH9_9COXI|nr:aminomethyl-transferring glycine dehydrogenase subunit GcvPB [Aquicella lusitana]RDI44580.1 glycine dehydrogenase (decarboxylating) beta subunit [Aquicella lusitana]VVC72478.1 putative glycine dehydrogenase (decarboxylating) subunit 2 [Aquicella lusitana]